MTERSTPPRPDTSDMRAVHQVFRDALGAAPKLIGTAANAGRISLVGSFYSNVLHFLEGHHEGEDLIVWPRLLERCPADIGTVGRISAQHHEVTPALKRSMAHVGPWVDSGDSARGQELADALASLRETLLAHLDEEEQFILPLCAAHLSAPEWSELPAHGLGTFQGDKVWLILGLIRENMTQHQRDEMLAHMPPPAVEMWATMGNAAFDSFVAELDR